MKKLLVAIVALCFLAEFANAGGIMTNTNQSASYIRMVARDASLDVDAVYFNPAGLTLMDAGFHLGLNNQTIFQTRKIENPFLTLNSNEYTGKVSAPIFPSVYAVYNTGKLAISGGFMVIGGGGGAEYETGLPSFETEYSLIPGLLSSQGIPTNAYDVDIFFEGSSAFFAGQIGLSYKLSDMFSVFGGVRYVMASNTYNGYLRNLQINPTHPFNPGGGLTSAPAFFTSLSNAAAGAASSVDPLVQNPSTAGLTLDQLVALSIIDAPTAAQLSGGLGAAYNPAMTITQVQATYTGVATQTGGFAVATADKEVDAVQKGTAFTPIIGVNISPSDKLNIGIKYEFLTKLEVENETTKDIDIAPLFPDGDITRQDMPAMLSVGVSYRPVEKLNISTGIHYYWDKNAEYGKSLPNDEIIDKNFIEFAIGLEYNVTPSVVVSGGYLRTQTGVNPQLYHTDLSHSLTTNTIGFGAGYSITPEIKLNLGVMLAMYLEDQKEVTIAPFPPVSEIYNRSATVFAIGLDWKIGR
jgi:long-chain fatty acid transport protein